MRQKGIQHVSPWRMVLVMVVLTCLAIPTLTLAERPPLTKNVPVWEFQNKGEGEAYDFDAPPKGIFRTIQFAEDFEEELGFRRGHLYIPVRPTEQFGAEARAVFIVFKLHQHYDPFQVTGLCYPEQVDGLNPKEVVAEDAVELNLEDDSGYLQLFAPPEGWKPGKYKVEIHLGWEVNATSLIGTMRFTVAS